MKQQIKSSLILLLTATIWGVAFVAQSVGMEYIGPFTFNAIRCVLGGMVLIPVILVLKKKKETGAENQEKEDKKTLWMGGIACGVILCIASNLQQFGRTKNDRYGQFHDGRADVHWQGKPYGYGTQYFCISGCGY